MIIRSSQFTILVGGQPLLLCEDLTFEPGQVHCIRGRSGTGKTSFLYALSDSKLVSLNGQGIQYQLRNEKEHLDLITDPKLGVHLSFSQQAATLWPHLTTFTNVWLPWASQCGFRKMFQRRILAQERAQNWLTQLGLDASLWKRRPFSLSGGERQRAALASALVFNSPCLLLDEPTSSLDRMSVNLVSSVLEKEANLGKLVIVTSHDVDFLENKSWHHWTIVENVKQIPRFRLIEVN